MALCNKSTTWKNSFETISPLNTYLPCTMFFCLKLNNYTLFIIIRTKRRSFLSDLCERNLCIISKSDFSVLVQFELKNFALASNPKEKKIKSVVVDLKSQFFVRYRFPLSRKKFILRSIVIGSGKWWSVFNRKSTTWLEKLKVTQSKVMSIELALEMENMEFHELFSHMLTANDRHANLRRHCTLRRSFFDSTLTTVRGRT